MILRGRVRTIILNANFVTRLFAKDRVGVSTKDHNDFKMIAETWTKDNPDEAEEYVRKYSTD